MWAYLTSSSKHSSPVGEVVAFSFGKLKNSPLHLRLWKLQSVTGIPLLRKPTARLKGEKMQCGSACLCQLVYMVLLGKNALLHVTVEQKVTERRQGLRAGNEVCLGLSGYSCFPWGHHATALLPPSAERELLTLLVQNISVIPRREVYSGRYLHQPACLKSGHCLVQFVCCILMYYFAVQLLYPPAVLSNLFGMTYTCCLGTLIKFSKYL